jgi:tripartite-type tricarboxylate transporter receptor subunit TctC
MSIMKRLSLIRALFAAAPLLALFAVGDVAAQDEAAFYQGKTVRFVVGTSPGGGYDIYARALAPHLQKRLGGLRSWSRIGPAAATWWR